MSVLQWNCCEIPDFDLVTWREEQASIVRLVTAAVECGDRWPPTPLGDDDVRKSRPPGLVGKLGILGQPRKTSDIWRKEWSHDG